jgi:hypothetical protein
MNRSVVVIALTLAAAVLSVGAQQSTYVLRDFAMGGGNYYLRAPEFVPALQATFLNDDDRVLGVAAGSVSKAYPAPAVTWHHGLEDRLGTIPIFVTW